jgi:glycerol-3-phosphate dehydrogenase (NAD(P)+)
MNEHISVIGDGGMGTICAVMLAENGNDVRLWSAFEEQAAQIARDGENRRYLPGRSLPEGITVTADESDAFTHATLIVSAVPTEFLRVTWERLADYCPPGVAICSVTKGIENDTLLRPSQVVGEVLGDPTRPMAVLSGPSIAPEIADGLPASVTVASEDLALAERIQQLISRPYFRVYTNPDRMGVELAGAIKNVIAIAAGVLDGMEMGTNAKAALLTRGTVELARLGEAMGASVETFAGLSGLGDLVTTCFSSVGRNRSFGEAIGSGKTPQQAIDDARGVVEGVKTTRSVMALAETYKVNLPICRAVYQVIFENRRPAEAIHALMTRPLKNERDEAPR